MDTLSVWKSSLEEANRLLNQFQSDPEQLRKCEAFTALLVDVFRGGNNLFLCGNGGSHCDAMHAAEEFTGRYRKNRRAMGALALGDAAHLTCVANDFGYEHVFARQLEGLGRKGDLLVGISTSGASKNVANAFDVAREKGMHTMALLGKDGGFLKDKADLVVIVPGKTAERIQEMHIKILHTAIEACERQLFPELW
jgi:D-sedoheptulose 7-phosphate isomerase